MMSRFAAFLVLLLLWSEGECENVIVQIETGTLRGLQLKSAKGRAFYAFMGIPYAQPTDGDLRFQPPVSALSWEGTYNATHDANVCPQLYGKLVIGDEDCLKVNVYTPQLQDNSLSELLPVMVFIHGGAFAGGGPQYALYRPERYMDYNVVLVTVAYRLGPFGFLSTGDSASLGNYGLLDQTFALKWVQRNIASFFGDRTKVTIFGESAGASSVSLHQLSQASAGLMRGIIAESGSALIGRTLQKHPENNSILLAGALGCPTDNNTNLVNCLRRQSMADIIHAAESLNTYSLLGLQFTPVVEDPVEGRFLKQNPVTILQEGTFNKVPMISGVNKDEGDLTYSITEHYYDVIDDFFYNVILPHLLKNLTNYENNLRNLSYAVKAEYFDGIDVQNRTQVARTAIDMNSDVVFKSTTDYTIRMLAKHNVTAYFYSFEYAGTFSTHNYTGEKEVSHGDELYYFFSSPLTTLNADDQFISDHLMDTWVNFATYLDPTPNGSDYSWTPTHDGEQMDYLQITNHSLTMQTGFLTERMKFWEETAIEIVAANDTSETFHKLS